jgi:hypothetical protein
MIGESMRYRPRRYRDERTLDRNLTIRLTRETLRLLSSLSAFFATNKTPCTQSDLCRWGIEMLADRVAKHPDEVVAFLAAAKAKPLKRDLEERNAINALLTKFRGAALSQLLDSKEPTPKTQPAAQCPS